MALYSDKVMDHFRNPRNVGIIDDADGVGEVGNPVCGDIMKIYLKIADNTITDVKFETFGCGSAIASSSMATELIKGKSLTDALALTNKAVTEALDGLPAHKLHCSVLAEEAIKKAVKDYYDKNGIPYDPSTETARSRTFCALEDVEDARSVAFRTGVPYYVFNFRDNFRSKVTEKYIQS